MTKGLEAFKRIAKYYCEDVWCKHFTDKNESNCSGCDLLVVETALNEKENIENRLDDIFSKHHIRSFTELEERLGDCRIASADDIKLKALNEILALYNKWLGNEMSDFEFFTQLNEITYKYNLLKEVLL